MVRLTLNGEPALPDLTLKSLRKANRPLMLGVFASAPGSRKVDAAADNVRIVVQN